MHAIRLSEEKNRKYMDMFDVMYIQKLFYSTPTLLLVQ